MHLLSDTDWVNPPLGLTPLPKPELAEGAGLPAPVSGVLVATDGLELDAALKDASTFSLSAQVQHLAGRAVPTGYPYPHGDIAAVQISVTGTNAA